MLRTQISPNTTNSVFYLILGYEKIGSYVVMISAYQSTIIYIIKYDNIWSLQYYPHVIGKGTEVEQGQLTSLHKWDLGWDFLNSLTLIFQMEDFVGLNSGKDSLR